MHDIMLIQVHVETAKNDNSEQRYFHYRSGLRKEKVENWENWLYRNIFAVGKYKQDIIIK